MVIVGWTDFHRHSFVVSAPAIWNNIPASIRDSGTLDTLQNSSQNSPLQLRLRAMPLLVTLRDRDISLVQLNVQETFEDIFVFV